jgi:hypothetical protein
VKSSPAKQILTPAISIQCDVSMKKKERWVVFREESKLVRIMDEVAGVKGIDRSDFIREAIRKRLSELGFFSQEVKTSQDTHQILENEPDIPAQKTQGQT